MQNGLVPIPLQPEPSSDVDFDNIDFGKCTECGQDLEESEFAVGNVCDGCMPAFMENFNARREAAAEEAAERRMYPEESDDDDLYDERRGY